MRKYLLSASVVALVVTAGCTTLTAPDEVKALKEATTDFAAALRESETAHREAREARYRTLHRADAALGRRVVFETRCLELAEATNEALDRQYDLLRVGAYDPAGWDTAYRTIRAIQPCDIAEAVPALPPLTTPSPSIANSSAVVSIGADKLNGAARNLEAYVTALSDIAGGETSGELDAARHELFEAGRGLIGALKVGGPVDAIINVAERGIDSVIAARRNAQTRAFLDQIDPIIPILMERLGLTARLANGQAAQQRARAAYQIAHDANLSLNGRTRRPGTPQRMQLYDDVAGRLQIQNNVLLNLRKSDPMTAARAFAGAHHELRMVYHDPRRHRAALAAGLRTFRESAAELLEALREND